MRLSTGDRLRAFAHRHFALEQVSQYGKPLFVAYQGEKFRRGFGIVEKFLRNHPSPMRRFRPDAQGDTSELQARLR